MPIIILKLIIFSFHNTKIINFNIKIYKIIKRYSKHDSPPNFLYFFCSPLSQNLLRQQFSFNIDHLLHFLNFSPFWLNILEFNSFLPWYIEFNSFLPWYIEFNSNKLASSTLCTEITMSN